MKLDALLGNVFLISDDPGRYTDEMIRKYKEARHLSEAEVLHVRNDNGIAIEYELDGIKREIQLF
ncbi:MAG: hypothetical protein LKF53_09030 [Solobacterium sp.]|jgi:hypothetical protein|nr:hypothetical protein [Solobacterium sp.]MCH4282070.1 hypothetical protein [Solobacterium sp.]